MKFRRKETGDADISLPSPSIVRSFCRSSACSPTPDLAGQKGRRSCGLLGISDSFSRLILVLLSSSAIVEEAALRRTDGARPSPVHPYLAFRLDADLHRLRPPQ